MFLERLKGFVSKNKKEIAYIFVLLAVTLPLRFINLGYSDYIGDEHKTFIEPGDYQSVTDFFLTRRKGPMQFLVTAISIGITGDYRNELAVRMPHTIFGLAAVVLFYFLVKKFTKSAEAGFVAALLLSLNGFIVGFSRIAQYQNQNLFFSFAALYFYLDLLRKDKDHLKSTLIGTLMFVFSLFSHWDAVFMLPQMVIIFGLFLLSKKVDTKEKVKLIAANTLLGCLLILPLFIPYWDMQQQTPDNIRYLTRRLDTGYTNLERYEQLIELYNPFLTLEFYIITALISLIWWRKSWDHWIWFGVNFGLFELFVRKPGTHIYNFLIPVFILCAIGIVQLIKISPKYLKPLLIGVTTLFFAYFFYQSYVVFVDHKVEYPWRNETFLTFLCKDMEMNNQLTKCGQFIVENFETPDYDIEEKLPLFGFPLSRRWNEINEIVKEDMVRNNLGGYGFLTNEEKTISQWYMDVDYRADNGYYVIGVKQPLSFREDYQFEHLGGKEFIQELRNEEGNLLVKIWRLDPKDDQN